MKGQYDDMAIKEYLKVKPVSLRSTFIFYYLGLKTFLNYFIFHRGNYSKNEEVNGLIKVKRYDI